MTGTLSGIYNAQRALSTNQAIIDLINNNIANMNTPGYSKQRADLEQLTSGNNSTDPQNACSDGLGAVISDVTRNRDSYIDSYYRRENSNLAYYEELSENAGLIEDITNELDGIGLNSSLNEFYNSLSQLSNNPTDVVARNNVVQKAIELTTKINSTYNRLDDLRTNLVGDGTVNGLASSKISSSTDDLNDKLAAVAELNDNIVLTSAQGNSPNYLLDQRDMLMDELTSLIPIELSPQSNGAVNISLGNTTLVSGGEQVGIFNVTPDTTVTPPSVIIDAPAIMQIENPTGGVLVADASSLIDGGKIGAILEMGGNDTSALTIKSIMEDLNTFASEFAAAFNTIQTAGQIIDSTVDPHVLTNDWDTSTAGVDPIENFFIDSDVSGTITAGNIAINEDIIDDPYKIAAADAASAAEETGDGTNSLAMYQMRDSLIAGLGSSTAEQFITNLSGEIGSKTSTIDHNLDIKTNITDQISLKRESITGVNLDEEMTDLIRFQRAYEASARIFSIVNQNIQTILNMI